MPDVVRIQRIGYLTDAARRLAAVPDGVLEVIYDEARDYVGQELKTGRHSERLRVNGEPFVVDLFADTDGTLWVTGVELTV